MLAERALLSRTPPARRGSAGAAGHRRHRGPPGGPWPSPVIARRCTSCVLKAGQPFRGAGSHGGIAHPGRALGGDPRRPRGSGARPGDGAPSAPATG
ncbi:hypothetical protein QJS66_13350 [Kocuria rhizophila]|nr:hypothetical protein QJS66_13350 [Kocuria rhizophila]